MAASGLEAVVAAPPAEAAVAAPPSDGAVAGPGEPLVAEDVLSAQVTARVRGVRVEAESLRSEMATTYVNPDGSFTSEQFAGPVRLRRAGEWVDVDATLERRADGTIAPKGSPSGLVLSGAHADSGAPQPLITVGSGAQQSVWQWDGALPEPVLNGHRATYPEVQPGVDLVVEASRTGFEQFFVLKSRPSAPVQLRVPVRLGSDANLAKTADGGLRLTSDGGRELGRGPAPMWWDSRIDPRTGDPAAVRNVPTTVSPASGGAVVTLTPQEEVLADPQTVYPVTIDPQVTYTPTLDTWVAENVATPQSGSTELRFGYTGTAMTRAFINIPWTLKSNVVISNAQLKLWNWFAPSCTAKGWQMWSTAAGEVANTSTVWGNQPTMYTNYGSSTATLGASGCSAGWVSVDATTRAQNWSNANYTTMSTGLRASVENDSSYFKKFNSGDAPSNIPSMVVTYNTKPSTPMQSSLQVAPDSRYSSAHYANTTTPKVSTLVSDPDGGSVKAQISIYQVDPITGNLTTVSTLNSGTSVVSGSRSTWTVPAGQLTNGNTYRFYARAHDGSLQSVNASAGLSFTVDTSAPSAPTVSSLSYPSTGWYGAAGQAGNFTLTPPASDVGWLLYALNSTSTSAATTVVATAGTAQTVSITPPTTGAHTLSVWTKDKAGNLSARTAYSFNVGTAALGAPRTGDTTAKHVALAATAAAGATGVRFQYRLGGTTAESNWADVPVANTTLNGTPLTAWPVTPTTASGTASISGLLWDAAASLNTDTALQVRAVFTGTQNLNTLPATITLDRRASSAGSDDIGPGSVNLLTGDHAISDSDGGAFGISVSRTYSSLYPTAGTNQAGQAGPFGVQWTAGADAPDSDFTTLEIGTDSATVNTADDTPIEFLLNNGTWTAEPGMTLTLTGPVSGAYTLTDTDGTKTVFTKPSTAASVLAISSVTPPGTATTTKYVYEAVVDNPTTTPVTKLRLKRIIAPTSAFADLNSCNVPTPPVGCRVLDLDYPATAGVPTGTNVGDYYPSTTLPSGARAKSITMWAATPANGGTPAAMSSTVITQYAYDSNGDLRQVWDPRITPALKTLYSYDSNRRVVSVTNAGQQPWTLTYDGSGRLATASRPTLAAGTSATTNGTATHTVVYNVPLSGTGAPNDLSATARATWGQTSVPTTATAVIGPDPSTGAGSTTAFSRGTVHYLDIEGNETNTATAGNFGAIDLDTFGNTIRELTPANRALALTDPAGTDPTKKTARDELAALGLSSLTSAERAAALSTRSVYDDKGVLLLDTYGPRQQVLLEGAVAASGASPALPAGSNVVARAHTRTVYDENRPTGAVASNLPTTVTAGAQIVGREAAPDADVRTTTTAYDWTLGQATSTTTDPGTGKLNITRSTTYDSSGRVWKTRMPNSAGGDAGETITSYYTATGTGPCAGRPEWADLLCQVSPGGVITGGGSNPSQLVTKTYTYTRTGQSDTVSETANSVTRTTTTSYDAADRPDTVSVTGGVGTAVPPVRTIYDPSSGAVTETQSLTAVGGTVTSRIERSYDTLGRIMSYKDADGATTTTSYDAGDRPTTATSTDAAGNPVSRTAMGYDASIEPRGMATSVTFGTSAADPAPLSWTGRYDNEGELSTADLPGSVQLSTGDDTVGNTTHRTYTQTGVNSPLLEDRAEYSIHGQKVTHDGLTHQDYTYDAAGRLITVRDSSPDGAGNQQCTTRAYTYDSNSNRLGTASATGPAAVGDDAAACPATPTVSTTMSYDSADRLVNSGYVYDAFGRTASLPGGLANAYFSTDLVASQTMGARTQTWTLDPNMRFRASTTTVSGTSSTAVNHYDADNDNPAWITEPINGTTTNRRYTTTLDGSLIDMAANTKLLHLTNIHGDNALALDLANTSAPLAIKLTDEFGKPLSGAADRYGWLGSKQRSADATGGVILMGVRLYNPALGRFLTVDPVAGGSANAYDYVNQDPVNNEDLDGRRCGRICRARKAAWGGVKGGARWTWNNKTKVAGTMAFGACVIGTAGVCGVAAGGAFAISAASRGHRLATKGRYKRGREWGRFGGGLFLDNVARRFMAVRHLGRNGRGNYGLIAAVGQREGRRRLARQTIGWGWTMRGF